MSYQLHNAEKAALAHPVNSMEKIFFATLVYNSVETLCGDKQGQNFVTIGPLNSKDSLEKIIKNYSKKNLFSIEVYEVFSRENIIP